MKTNLHLQTGLLFFALLAAVAIAPLSYIAQGLAQEGKEAPATESKAEETKPKVDEAKPEKKASPITAVVGGDIHTVSGPVIRGGTVLIQDGKILEVGQGITIPADATVVDAAGKIITPGFVAISMQNVGVRATPGNRDKLVDSLDPFDRNIKYSLGAGITTGCIELSTARRGGRRRPREGEAEERFPGLDAEVQDYVTEAMMDYGNLDTSLCPCCGLPVLPTEPITPAPPTVEQPRNMAAIKLSYGHLESMLLKEEVFYSPSPGALNGALNRHNWRRDIKKAKEAIEAEKKKAEQGSNSSSNGNTAGQRAGTGQGGPSGGPSGGPPGGRRGGGAAGSNAAGNSAPNAELMALVKGEVALRVTANTANEISEMLELAKELGYRIIIEGGVEAWVVADDLGAVQSGVIYTPRQRRQARPDQEDTSGSNIESTRIFQDLGVPFAVTPLENSVSMGGLAGRDLISLPLEAAFAVRGGASEKTVLESITIVPAKMMGLDDRIGSIEAGKDADLLILNGSPLDYRTYVEKAIVAGQVAYERDKDRVFPLHERVN